jgi:hypothetical protein
VVHHPQTSKVDQRIAMRSRPIQINVVAETAKRNVSLFRPLDSALVILEN